MRMWLDLLLPGPGQLWWCYGTICTGSIKPPDVLPCVQGGSLFPSRAFAAAAPGQTTTRVFQPCRVERRGASRAADTTYRILRVNVSFHVMIFSNKAAAMAEAVTVNIQGWVNGHVVLVPRLLDRFSRSH